MESQVDSLGGILLSSPLQALYHFRAKPPLFSVLLRAALSCRAPATPALWFSTVFTQSSQIAGNEMYYLMCLQI